jgi:hypothetical protein
MKKGSLRAFFIDYDKYNRYWITFKDMSFSTVSGE